MVRSASSEVRSSSDRAAKAGDERRADGVVVMKLSLYDGEGNGPVYEQEDTGTATDDDEEDSSNADVTAVDETKTAVDGDEVDEAKTEVDAEEDE